MPLPAGSVVVSLFPPQPPAGGSGALPSPPVPPAPPPPQSGICTFQTILNDLKLASGGLTVTAKPADALTAASYCGTNPGWILSGGRFNGMVLCVEPGYYTGTGRYLIWDGGNLAYEGNCIAPSPPPPPGGGGTQPTGGGGGGSPPGAACTTLCGPLTIQTTCDSPLWIKTCPEPPAPVPPCELTIAWLSLHYPDFVQAERSAAKTDYDVLFDAFKLGLCSGAEPQMPECSVPYLERVAPAFVQAAKVQGKTDVEMLTDAATIGLCARVPDVLLAELGATNPEELAPGSAGVIQAEFDPTPFVNNAPNTVETGASGNCPPADFVLPDLSDTIAQYIPKEIECLTGLDRAVVGIGLVIARAISDTCNCPDGSVIDQLFASAAAMKKEWTVGGKAMGSIVEFLARIFRSAACNLGVADNYVRALTGCGAGSASPTALFALLAGIWERWVGKLPNSVTKAMDRALDFACPSDPPSSAEANALYVTNFLSRSDWECIQRSQGARLDYQEQIVKMEQRRPTDDQLLLLQRKLRTAADNAAAGTPQIGDPGADYIPGFQEQIAGLFQNNGWTNDINFSWWETAQTWVPAPTDAVQWMLKDVADPQIQNTFLLGAEFQQKYNGHVKDVFSWNGITDTDAEFIWRSHWRNMAPTTLYELHKRLRPGWTTLMSDAEVTELVTAICPRTPQIPGFNPLLNRPTSNGFPVPTYCEELADPAVQRQWLESLVTTGYHVSEGLGQDDFAPFWRARLLAISYRVLTRVDARRAYEINSLSFEQLIATYQDQGYSPGDANRVATFTRNAAIQLHSRRPAANQWVNTGYDSDKLRIALERQGMRPDMWADVYAILRARRDIKIQQDCIKSLEKSYMVSLITQDQLDAQLEALGLDGTDRFNLIKDWNCIKANRTKQETATSICLYFKTGLLSGPDAQTALIQLGYTKAQARRILATCYIKKLPKTYDVSKLPAAIAMLGTLPE